jgi:hypothetical protein
MMNRRTYLKSILLALLFPRSFAGQSRAYAKFGSSGETVGLFNLMRDRFAGGSWQVFEGSITGVSVARRDDDVEYRFGLEARGNRSLVVRFTLKRDDLSETDVRALVEKRMRVKVRACRTGRVWTAEEITRL